MTTVGAIAAWMERAAPTALAEDWDNVGLLLGDPASKVERVLTCLTVSPGVVAEAIEAGAGLIVSHHPILFRPTQKLRADNPDGAMLLGLARAGIAVVSHHTAFDNAPGGMNDLLADRLGLVDVGPLRPSEGASAFKLVVFAPIEAREAVLSAAFGAGAGRIGNYEQCSFSTSGQGTFFGGEGSAPKVGRPGVRESVDEVRVEILVPGLSLESVLAAIRRAHPYEEPAIDAIPVRDLRQGPGVGRVGRLPEPIRLEELAGIAARALGAPETLFAGDPGAMVRRLAIACGAGDSFLGDAARKADALLTGEARFHRGLEAEAKGVGLIVVGHHASERPGVEDLARRLKVDFPGLDVGPSRREADPFRRPG